MKFTIDSSLRGGFRIESVIINFVKGGYMYKIGLFSKMNMVTVKTLRHYDEIGLLKPAHIDHINGYRYYSSKQLPVLHQILALKRMGFSLDEIKSMNSGISYESLLESKKRELTNIIDENRERLSQVEYYLKLERESVSMNYNVIIKELPEVIVAYNRLIIPNYGALNEAMPRMGEEMRRLGCVCLEPEYCFTIYHDGEYREENVDVEICEAVTEAKKDTDVVKFKKLKSVPEAACILHKGSYSTLGNSYGVVMSFIENNGYEVIDLYRESYIDGIWNKKSEDEWLTEIQVPVRKIAR